MNVAGERVVSPTLVGRTGEIELLVDGLSSPPAVVVVEGEAGIGKTRLVGELRVRPELRGRRIVAGSCHHVREPFPLGPVIDVVRQLVGELGKLDLSPLAGTLRPLLPELADALPPPLEQLDDRLAERHRVFRALVEVLDALGPAIMVLEDLHWADDQTVDFARYLLSDPPAELALVLTFRAEELDPAVRTLTARLPESIGRAHLELAPLDAVQTGALAAAILGTDRLSPEFAAHLYERTSGLPFAVEELLALLQTRGSLVRRGSGWARRTLDELDVPSGIRDSVLERVSRLSGAARAVAEAAAVLQTPARVSVLVEASGVSTLLARRGLEETLALGVLTEHGDLVGFRHLLAAQAVYGDIAGPRRHDLHARAAATLERLRPAPLGQVAYHLRHADRLDDWVDVAEQAADQATALGDDDGAARVLGDVLRHGPLDDERRGRVAVKLARVALETTRGPQLVGLLSGVLERGSALPRSVRGELRFRVALLVARGGGDTVELHRLFEAAADELTDRQELRAWAMVCLGMPTAPRVPLDEHVAWLHRALEIVPTIGDPVYADFLRGKIAMVLVALGDPVWRRITARILERTDGTPSQPREVSAYCSIGLEACYAGHHETADRLLTAARRGAATCESTRTQLSVRSVLALLDYCRGHWNGLGDEIASLDDDLDEMPRHRIYVQVVAGCLALAHGELDVAERLLDSAVRRIETLGESDLLPMSAAALTRVMCARGEFDNAATIVDRFLAHGQEKGTWAVTARILPALAQTMVGAGRAGEAIALVDRLADELDELDAPLAPATVHHARGLLDVAAERRDDAARHLLTAADLYEQLQCPYEAAQAREEAAGCLFLAGDRLAEETLRLAMVTYRRLGATWDGSRAASIARRHGMDVPHPRRGGRRSYGEQLSPREREVADLAAAGLTNREIAQHLFLSPRTVDTHLAAVRRKLSVRTRTAIARRLDQTSASTPPKTTQFT